MSTTLHCTITVCSSRTAHSQHCLPVSEEARELNLKYARATRELNPGPFALADECITTRPPRPQDMFGLTVNVLDVRSQMADVKSQMSTMVLQIKKMKESQRLLAKRLTRDRNAKQSSWPAILSIPARLQSTRLLHQPSTRQPRRQFLVPPAPTTLLFLRHRAHPTPTL